MKIKRFKRLIISIILILFVWLIGFSILNINFKILKNKKKVSAGYNFTNGRIKDTDDFRYTDNTEFHINNAEGLFEFSVSVAYGLNFANKVVYVDNDIDYGASGMNWQPIGASMDGTTYHRDEEFRGEFDGNSHIISNLNCTIETCDEGLLGKFCNLGFFADISHQARIKNLKIKNFTITNYDMESSDVVSCNIGGICGLLEMNATIENCIIEKFTVNNYEKDSCIGGFIGESMTSYELDNDETYVLKVANCYLQDFTLSGEVPKHVASFGPAEGTNANYSKVDYDNVVIRNSGDYNLYTFYTGILDWDDFITTKHITTNNIFNTKNGAKQSISNNSAWHQSPNDEFNDGWPYLCSFIIFNTYEFYSEGNGKITGSTSIKVPAQVQVTVNTSLKEQIFYGQPVIAEPSTGYKFTRWKELTSTPFKFMASFQIENYNLSFKLLDPRGNELECSQRLVKVRYAGTYRFSGTFSETGTNIKLAGQEICELPAMYTFRSYTVDGTETESIVILVPDYGEDGATVEVTIKLKYKTYDVNYS